MSEGDSGATAECPSLPWRLLSQTTLIGVGALCRGFLFGLSNPEINGLDSFLEILEERKDPAQRTRGLLTGKYTTGCNARLRSGQWLTMALSLG